MVRYVGLDVHKHSIVSCTLDEQGKVTGRAELHGVDGESLLSFAQHHLHSEDHVALEATTNANIVAGLLHRHVARVVVSNPLATKIIAQSKVKTDKVDAYVLAQLLRLDFLPSIWRADAETSKLRQWTARRSRLVSHKTAIVNRIHALLAQRLIVCPFDLDGPNGRYWLKQQAPLDTDDRWLLDSDLRLLEAVEDEIAAITREMAKHGYADPRVKLLMTLPGVSQHTAQSLLAAIGEVSRFHNPKQLASYLGLTPSVRQSGEHCYYGKITKRGRCHTRWMLVQAAHAVAKHPGPLGHFFRKLRTRKNHNVAVVATAHKLATIAWHILKTGEPYRYAIPKSTETKLVKLRVLATGEKRKGGTAKGVKSAPKVPGQVTRVERGLDEVYASEGLPPMGPAPAGEERHLVDTGLVLFAREIRQTKRVPRKPSPKASTRTSAQRKRRRQTPKESQAAHHADKQHRSNADSQFPNNDLQPKENNQMPVNLG